MDAKLSERNATLWILPLSPSIWALHFLLCYVTAAVFCAKTWPPQSSLWSVRVAIAAYTALALGGIAVIAYFAFRANRYKDEPPPHDADTAEDRHRFLGFAALLLAGLSAVAVVYSALAAVFIRSCE
jgi:hypothetical protein